MIIRESLKFSSLLKESQNDARGELLHFKNSPNTLIKQKHYTNSSMKKTRSKRFLSGKFFWTS